MTMNIRPRGNRWQARVTVAGQSVSKTFTARSDAERWARHQQVLMERGEWTPPASAVTLADVITRYEQQVLPLKRGAAQEKYILRAWKSSPLGQRRIDAIKPADIAQARDRRMEEVSPTSVRRYLDTLSGVFQVAIRDWELITSNPVGSIRKPSSGRARDRRVLPEEAERIVAATRSTDLPAIVALALQTAMRRGEILDLRWSHIDFTTRTALLPLTKNGEPRTVPLTRKAVEVLRGVPRGSDDRVFRKNGTSLSECFRRAAQRAREAYERERLAAGASPAEVERDKFLRDIRLHDCRHERVSNLVESGFNLAEVAAVSGHKTLACLKRYTHVKPAHLVARLDLLSA